MSSEATTSRTTTGDFEQALTTLILEAFAAGALTERTWEITPASVYVPDWRITIEETTAAKLPANHETFVNE